MNYLITAGPTREYIDPVRFISNASSGRQGIAIAEEAKKKGHKVILIMGPCSVGLPYKIPVVRVTTAKEMFKMVLQYKDWMDVFIMNAAVSDWRVVGPFRQKVKKDKKVIDLKLVLNPDILAYVGKLRKQKKTKPDLLLAGFSVDTMNIIPNAKKKLMEKNLDIIVANPIDSFESTATRPIIIDMAGKVTKLPPMSKKELAARLVGLLGSYRRD